MLAVGPLAGSVAAAAPTLRVSWGDTLWSIAARTHTSVAALAAANHLADPNHIVAGTVLVVPAPGGTAPSTGGSLVVAPGDTLWGIAQRLGVPVGTLASLNGLSDPNRLLAGTSLVLPATGIELTASATPLTAPAPPAAGPASPGGLPAKLLAHPGRLTLLPLFRSWAAAEEVPSSLLEALCWWESGWQAGVVSPTDAYGIGQLEPATVDFVRTVLLPGAALDPASPSDNIEMAAAYLHWLLVSTGQRPDLALAGYYQGLRSVELHGMAPATRQYVDGILAYAPRFAAAGG
jgi:LysM repeat protein